MTHRPTRWDVLHVVEPSIGGAPAVASQLAGWEAEAGLRVGLVGHPQSATLRGEPPAFDRIGLDLGLGPRAVRNGWDLRRVLARTRVVHLHSSRAALIGRLANVRPTRPSVFTPHGWSWHVASPTVGRGVIALERLLARRVTVLHALSPAEADDAVRLLAVDADRVALIPNGVDLTRFTPAAGQGDPSDGPLRLLVVGRLCRQKGQDLLLDALTHLAPRRPVAVSFAGEGPDLDQLRARAAALPPGCTASFLGPVPDPAPLYRATDLVVLPSRWEGQSLALLEALASGCPVVATGTSGTEGVHGVATCEPTVAALAELLHRHVHDDGARRSLADEAIRHRAAVGEEPVRTQHLALKQRLLDQA